MTANLSVNELKELVRVGGDLSFAINYFFDMLDADLLPCTSISTTGDHELQVVVAAANEVVANHFNVKTKVTSAMLKQSLDKEIVHGGCIVSGLDVAPSSPINILYVREVKVAIVFMNHNNDTNTEFWRLSFKEVSSQNTYH